MNRSELVARITTAERQLAFLREELEKEDSQRYYMDEVRCRGTGKLKAAIIRDRKVTYPKFPRKHFPVATVDRVGNLTEDEVLYSAKRLLAMYRSSER